MMVFFMIWVDSGIVSASKWSSEWMVGCRLSCCIVDEIWSIYLDACCIILLYMDWRVSAYVALRMSASLARICYTELAERTLLKEKIELKVSFFITQLASE
jgi:hypothetical protein